MKKNGAQLAVFALEQLGVKHTFGIPGTHTTELYDALNSSSQITPVLVTHEGGASFMADGVSRSSGSIGVLVIVPAAGLTHAMSGIGEAYLDGIPMLIISGGTRTDSGRHYQLHQFDQMALASNITKAQFSINSHEEVISTIYKAYDIATSGEPGPVFIELPVNIQLFSKAIKNWPEYRKPAPAHHPDPEEVKQAADILQKAANPMLFLGWGALGAFEQSTALADLLAMPVATTLQGKSAFPNSHPLYTCVGLGKSAKPSGQWALKQHDALLAVGVRFSEIATGSYGLEQPKNLIHVDINPDVFDKNYKTTLAVEADAGAFMRALLEELKSRPLPDRNREETETRIVAENKRYFDSWLNDTKEDIVAPGMFFNTLRAKLDEDAFLLLDDGKHTFLGSELFPVNRPARFISPTDFNCMGYCVPAAIGVKLANPNHQVAAIVGDGAFLMTGMEMITSVVNNAPIVYFVFNDGELGQISQFQQAPLNRKTCSELGMIKFEGIAMATGVEYLKMSNNEEIDPVMDKALDLVSRGKTVLVEVIIDYAKKTMLTKGVIKTNLARFPLNEKVRFIARAVKRKITG